MIRKPRAWACQHCQRKNAPASRRCGGCGIGRATKRKSISTRCDSMWAKVVKSGGVCAARAIDIPCGGALEAAHVVPRRHRSVRWDLSNGRALCHAHHRFYTDSELRWRMFIGPEWDRLWELSQQRWDGNFPIAELSAALKKAA